MLEFTCEVIWTWTFILGNFCITANQSIQIFLCIHSSVWWLYDSTYSGSYPFALSSFSHFFTCGKMIICSILFMILWISMAVNVISPFISNFISLNFFFFFFSSWWVSLRMCQLMLYLFKETNLSFSDLFYFLVCLFLLWSL